MAKTAARRHHVNRLKQKRKLYWGRYLRGFVPLDEKQLGKIARTPNSCNCWMCKNPRKVWGSKAKLAKDLREKALIESQEQVAEEVNRRMDLLDNELENLALEYHWEEHSYESQV